MGNRGSVIEQARSSYSQSQIHDILDRIGISIVSKTVTDFLCLCPLHDNRRTPSLSVSRYNGSYICFSPMCSATGNLLNLVMRASGRNEYEALRLVESLRGVETDVSLVMSNMLNTKDEWPSLPQPEVDRLHRNLWASEQAVGYLHRRGFNDETLDTFEIGYSDHKKMIAIPVHNPGGVPVGIVGRSIEGKAFKNSVGLPTSKLIFNFHRAKYESDEAIVTESAFDTMRIWQVGFRGAVGLLGGSLSPEKVRLLDRNFSSIMIFTDFDDKSRHIIDNCRKCHPNQCQGHNPGRDLGYQIRDRLPHKEVKWASIGWGQVYGGVKDAGEMTDRDISLAVENAVPDFQYRSWNLY